MKGRILASALLALGVAACEQESQTMPFSVDYEATTVRPVSGTDATSVTSAAGASLLFPAGSFSTATEVSVTPVAPPAGITASGSPVSRGFRVTPEGAVLNQPARVELRIDSEIESSRAWLASVVVVTADGVEEIGNTRLDLRAGLAEASIRRLGTLAVVIPEPRAVFVTRSSAVQPSVAAVASSLLPTGTDSVVARCGSAEARCDGLSVTASANLVDKVEQAAAVFPHLSGDLSITGDRASGEISLRTSVRILMKSGATSENVEVHGVLRATPDTRVTEDASSITLSNVSYRISGSVDGGEGSFSDTVRNLVIEKGDGIGFATLSRTFELQLDSDQPEPASVEITFPVHIHQ